MPTSQNSASARTCCRKPSLSPGDGELLDQDGGTAAEPSGKGEARIVGEAHHLAQQVDQLPGDSKLADRLGPLPSSDAMAGEAQRDRPGRPVEGCDAGQ